MKFNWDNKYQDEAFEKLKNNLQSCPVVHEMYLNTTDTETQVYFGLT